jgi:hypothetical protein
MLRVRNTKGFNLAPCLPKIAQVFAKIANLLLLVSFSIVFAASPSAAHPKKVELCYHTAQASSHHACAENGNLERPHLPIIDEDNWVDWWLVVGWIWSRRTSDTQCT